MLPPTVTSVLGTICLAAVRASEGPLRAQPYRRSCLSLAVSLASLHRADCGQRRAHFATASQRREWHGTLRKRTLCSSIGRDQDDDDTFEDDDDQLERGIDVGQESWAQLVLDATKSTLEHSDLQDIKLYAFKTFGDKRVEIRLDKLTNMYGSPGIADITQVAKGINSHLLDSLGEDAAGEVEINVSSPGAERRIYWDELERFQGLPLVVAFNEKDAEDTQTRIFDVESINHDASQIHCKLAEVSGNSPGKGRVMNKRMREQRWQLHKDEVVAMQLYIDF